MAMLDKARLAVRRTGVSVFDAELQDLINSACLDLGIAGVEIDTYSPNKDYVVGDRCIYDGMYYVCIAPTAGAFSERYWNEDGLICTAICTYVKCHFGETDEYMNLKASYDEQKAQLQMSEHYTDYSMIKEKTECLIPEL